jgi:hypothetical protein
MTPEIRERVDILRSKQANGTMTLEDAKEAIALLRQGRISVAASGVKSKKSNTVTQVDLDDL